MARLCDYHFMLRNCHSYVLPFEIRTGIQMIQPFEYRTLKVRYSGVRYSDGYCSQLSRLSTANGFGTRFSEQDPLRFKASNSFYSLQYSRCKKIKEHFDEITFLITLLLLIMHSDKVSQSTFMVISQFVGLLNAVTKVATGFLKTTKDAIFVVQ